MPQWTQWPHWKSQVDPYAEGHSHKHGTTSEAAMRKALGQLHGWQDPNVQKEAPKAKLGLKLKTPSRRTPMKIDSEHYPLSPDMIPASKARRAQQQNLPAALPSGTRLNVWWSDEEEPFECEVMEWRLVSEAGAERPVYMHRCQYEGGVIDHDLAEVRDRSVAEGEASTRSRKPVAVVSRAPVPRPAAPMCTSQHLVCASSPQIVFEVVPGTMASSLLKQESARAASARLHGANAKMTENLSPPSSPLKSTVIKRGRLAMWEKPKTSSEMIAEAHKVPPTAPAPLGGAVVPIVASQRAILMPPPPNPGPQVQGPADETAERGRGEARPGHALLAPRDAQRQLGRS